MPERCDVAIVGAGAAGLAAAWRLATSGLHVIVLEQGGPLDQSRAPSQAAPSQAAPSLGAPSLGAPSLGADWERALQTTFNPDPDIRRLPADYPVDTTHSPIRPATYPGIGGATLRWGAHFPRLRPSDFRVRSLDGVASDWPITYADLEPWFDLNDRMTGVSGLVGDPANPPRPAGTRLPPLPLGPGPTRLAAAFDRLGWHWWPSDAAISSAACNNCGPCGVGCPRHARASADTAYGRPAAAAGADIRPHARALHIAATPTPTLTYIHQGVRRTLRPRTLVLAANGMGTPRLMLASGLPDPSGQLGRNLMHHPTAIVTGLFAEPQEGHRGPFACALYSQHFIESDPTRGFLRGYQLQALRGGGPVQTALGGYMARTPWGAAHHQAFRRRFNHAVSLTITTEDLPDPQNRVTLHPTLTDQDGLPAPALHYRLSENTRAMLRHGIAHATRVLTEAGAGEVAVNPLSAAAGFHFLGTAGMGRVTDAWCRVHGTPGLMVIDGSVFTTAGAVNPTATLQAIALRAADALAQRLHAGQDAAA